MIGAIVAAAADSPPVPIAAGVAARLDALTQLPLAAEPVVGPRFLAAVGGNPKPVRQIEVFDLDNGPELLRCLRDPEITDSQVFNEDIAAPRDGPVAGRFRVAAVAEAAFLAYKRQAGKSFIMNGERGGNRTCNLLIKSQLLCQLSYAPTCESNFSILQRFQPSRLFLCDF